MTIGCKGSVAADRVFLLLGLLVLMSIARSEQLPLKSYTRTNELVQGHTQRIVQDSRGFLWFCTSFGLSRFDGYRFTTYGVEQGLPLLAFNDLLETHKGVYWVATNGDGVYRLNLHVARAADQPDAATDRAVPLFTHYRVGDNSSSNRVNKLYEDRRGQVWAGTDAGLFQLDESNGLGQFLQVELGLHDQPERTVQVWDFVEALEGSLWIATKFGLVRRLPDARMIHYWMQAPRGRDLVRTLLEDRNGRLWVGHESMGLIVFRPSPVSAAPAVAGRPWQSLRTHAAVNKDKGPQLPEAPGEALLFTTADGLGSNNLTSLTEDRGGNIWVGTYNGLAVLQGTHLRNYTIEHGLNSNVINCVKEDGAGNLWIGTSTAGVMRLAQNGFVTFLPQDGLGHEATYSIFENRDGEIFVVSREGCLNKLRGERFTAVRPNLVNGPANDLRDALEDRDGEWWFATVHGLYHFPKVKNLEQLAKVKPKAFYTVKDGLADNDARRIYEDSRGDIWIGTFIPGREVLTRWDRATATFHRYSDQDGLPPYHGALLFREDRAGQVWIGFRDGQLARFSQGRFTVITKEDGLPESSVIDLHLDNSGRLWVATDKSGVSLIEDPAAVRPRLTNYTTAQGLISDYIYCIAEDDKGRLYISTALGIDRLDPVSNLIKPYSSNEGIMSVVVGARTDRQGAIWFATRRGVSKLVPQADQNQLPIATLIGGVRISGVVQPISELGEAKVSGLELRPEQNNIQIDFFGLSLSKGETLRYQFQIEGVDKDWSAPTDQRSVNLSLAPGAYRFLVRTISADGAASGEPAFVAFKILPPIWRRWWFMTTVGLALMIPILAFARYRAARVKALRESENQFRALAETASDAIFAVDAQGKVVFINPAAEHIFGYQREDMLQQDMARFIPRYLRSLHLAGFGGDGTEVDISWDTRELRGLHLSGHEIPLELSFGEFTRRDKRYFTIIARDVTERKRAEEALRKTREERLKELEQVRQRIAADLHDDIGSSLSQINLLSEVARRGAQEAPQVYEPLSRISTTSHELLNSMSDIVWAINPHKDHLSDLVHRMRRFAGETLNARNIPFQFQAPDSDQDFRLGANIRREVFLIFKESVNNSARHSGCTEARIAFRIEDDCLRLTVSDNGKGFDTTNGSDGYGLPSMRKRAAAMGGRLEFISGKGNGTTVRLTVPLGD